MKEKKDQIDKTREDLDHVIETYTKISFLTEEKILVDISTSSFIFQMK